MVRFIVLTGGPGGGKTTLIRTIRQLVNQPDRMLFLPESVFIAAQIGISFKDRLFQRLILKMQCALEDGVRNSLESDMIRTVFCHRGALDPLAYWVASGWDEQEFYRFVDITRSELYDRYALVLHLVTAADGASSHYQYGPNVHRRETPDQALIIDQLLQQIWQEHPYYYRLDNQSCDWQAKCERALDILGPYMG